MNRSQRQQVQQFFTRVEARIAQETRLANSPGISHTARNAAATRAQDFAFDLDYLRDRYGVTTAGQGSAR